MRTEKFKNLFWFGPKSNIKAGDGLEKGRFPFYTSSPKLTKWIDKEQYFDEALIFGTGGLASVHFEDQPFSTSTDCIVAITTNKEIKTKFVYYYLFGNIHLLERGFKGAGLKHISKKYIENLDIPIFPIETQNKIVAILDKASSLVKKREELLDSWDKIIQAVYYEMFGDSYLNNKGFKTLSIEEVCTDIVDCLHTTPSYIDNVTEFPCIRTSEIRNGEIFWDSMKYLDATGYEKRIERLTPSYQDIIFAREGTVGDAAIIPENLKISLGQRVMMFRVNKEIVTSKYFWAFIRSNGCQYLIKKKTIGATVQRINIKDVKNISCPIPDLERQRLFDSKCDQLLAVKKELNQSNKHIFELYNSIVQKVFNGQLNFNVDFELDALIKEIDLQKKENNLSKIAGDISYLQRLVDKLNNQEFKEKDLYDKAKHVVFQLMAVKEEERKVIQEYDEKSKSLKLTLK